MSHMDVMNYCRLCQWDKPRCDVCGAGGEVYHVQAVWPEFTCAGHAHRQCLDELMRRWSEARKPQTVAV